MKDNYKHGDYNVICDRSGFKCKASETRKEWNGLRVRKDFWEPRHPQDKIRGRVDKQSVADPRPDSDATFLADVLTNLLTEAGESLIDQSGNELVIE